MNTHESMRNLLPLAAAGALGQQEQLQVEAHTRICQSCRRELDGWSVYTAGLRSLPQPSAREDLIARTQARVLRERDNAAAKRRNSAALCGLGVFSWVASICFWLLIRELAGDRLVVLGANLVDAGPWFFVSFTVSAITAATTALLVGDRREMGRAL